MKRAIVEKKYQLEVNTIKEQAEAKELARNEEKWTLSVSVSVIVSVSNGTEGRS